ncbi:hypothetical protein D9M72_610410 [compost metagenome]
MGHAQIVDHQQVTYAPWECHCKCLTGVQDHLYPFSGNWGAIAEVHFAGHFAVAYGEGQRLPDFGV